MAVLRGGGGEQGTQHGPGAGDETEQWLRPMPSAMGRSGCSARQRLGPPAGLGGAGTARPVQVAGDTLAVILAEGWVAGKHLQSTERDYSTTIVLWSCSVVEL